ncbi:unnamed protein product [Moneuplotes crassus]|uniref:Uncharacterized protein n=1 Tax=Euplotes crassus TaxID=5936 RepID=A0AAD1XRG9_EUPCR|nr:unnamed protein product [Moneuplotes crassus]
MDISQRTEGGNRSIIELVKDQSRQCLEYRKAIEDSRKDISEEAKAKKKQLSVIQDQANKLDFEQKKIEDDLCECMSSSISLKAILRYKINELEFIKEILMEKGRLEGLDSKSNNPDDTNSPLMVSEHQNLEILQNSIDISIKKFKSVAFSSKIETTLMNPSKPNKNPSPCTTCTKNRVKSLPEKLEGTSKIAESLLENQLSQKLSLIQSQYQKAASELEKAKKERLFQNTIFFWYEGIIFLFLVLGVYFVFKNNLLV